MKGNRIAWRRNDTDHRRSAAGPTARTGVLREHRGHRLPMVAVDDHRCGDPELAHWDPTQQVIEVNLETNEERTLDDDDVVTLKPGHGFAKKIRFQRG